MKLSRVGNQTNSPDPVAVNSRVFVGNLNTFQCSKAEVERMFQRYGRIAGISMHKGYAFVQFANAFDARSACLGEDKRMVLGQQLDVNLVSEPKAHQTGRKRQNVNKTGNDWDYYYDSYYASVGLPTAPPPRLAPPHKRPRLMLPMPGRSSKPLLKLPMAGHPLNGHPLNSGHPLNGLPLNGHPLNGHPSLVVPITGPASPPGTTPAGTINIFSNPDILICGNCREMYTDLQDLLQHKKSHCKLRFACKCRSLPDLSSGGTSSEAGLLCSTCRACFTSAWDLMVHVQAAHMLNIYQLGVPEEPSQTPPSTPQRNVKGDGSQEDGAEEKTALHPCMAGAGCSCGAAPAGATTGVAASDLEEDVAASPAVSTASDADIVLSTTVECALAPEPMKLDNVDLTMQDDTARESSINWVGNSNSVAESQKNSQATPATQQQQQQQQEV